MNKNILAIGAHPDDLEFGCVGTLVKHKLRDDNVTIVVMSKGDIKDAFSGNILRSKSESVLETKCSAEVLGLDLIHLSYEDTKVPFSVFTI